MKQVLIVIKNTYIYIYHIYFNSKKVNEGFKLIILSKQKCFFSMLVCIYVGFGACMNIVIKLMKIIVTRNPKLCIQCQRQRSCFPFSFISGTQRSMTYHLLIKRLSAFHNMFISDSESVFSFCIHEFEYSK